MTNHGLYLRIESEPYEVDECPHCEGSGYAPNCQFSCSWCHGSGTGTRTVRLVTKRDHPGVEMPEPVITQRMGTDILEIGYSLIGGGWGTKEEYHESVIDAWNDRTLPPEIAEGLEEIDVKENER